MTKSCTVEGCDRFARARGWCLMHYQRWRKHGDPTVTRVLGGLSGPDDPRHGTVNGYSNLGCRCDGCREAWRIEHLRYMEAHPEQREKHRARERAKYRAARSA